jgi:replicative DNA helicase
MINEMVLRRSIVQAAHDMLDHVQEDFNINGSEMLTRLNRRIFDLYEKDNVYHEPELLKDVFPSVIENLCKGNQF